jgi:glycosyltransferase involved in cell wall biosynthesis
MRTKTIAFCNNGRMTPAASNEPDVVAGRDSEAWVIIPLYNEATVIGRVVSELLERFVHVVCIDDGSTDGSASVAAAAGARVLRHPVNLGQGAALQTGLSYVTGKPEARYVVTFDADGQHRIEDAEGMLLAAREHNAAIIFGSRFLDDRTQPGWLKKVILKTAVWVTNRTTGLRLTDAHNGLRVIRADAARQIDLQQDRMAHATEIVHQLGRTQLPWEEYPVELLYTDYSKGKGQSVLNSVNILVDLLVR